MTHLDAAMPRWLFRERHSIRIAASPERVFDAIRSVTAREIFLFRTLTFIRRFGRPCRPSILNPPPDEPLLDVATRSGFRYVNVDPPNEIVIEIDAGPNVVATMNFLVAPPWLSTETRIVAKTLLAKIAFALYWLAIRAGSGFIRRMWLRAIRKRAEGSA